jgi:hypothetical protein
MSTPAPPTVSSARSTAAATPTAATFGFGIVGTVAR